MRKKQNSLKSSASGISEQDISAHPKFLALQKEVEDLQLSQQSLQNNHDDIHDQYKKLELKYELVYNEFMRTQDDCGHLEIKINTNEKYIEKLKLERNEYKIAWENVDR